MIHAEVNDLIVGQRADELRRAAERQRFARSVHRRLLACFAITALGVLGVAATPALAASSTFGYSSNYQYFSVPSGVTTVGFDVIGGSGANGQGTYGGGSGGSGAEVSGNLAVTPGEVLTIWPGGAGQPGGGPGYGNPSHTDFEGGTGGSANGATTGTGGGGGAASYILAGGGVLVVAGGGGGGGGGGYYICTNSNLPGSVPCYSAGAGGQGAANSGGGGGAGGDSFADSSATNVSFTSSGFSASTAGQITLSYGAASATEVNSPAASSLYGQSIRFTAAVDPSDGGGTVTFKSDGTVIAGCSNLSFEAGGGTDWLTSCTTSSLPPGTHTITAIYSGDGNYLASSGSITETIEQTATSTSLASSTNPSLGGQALTYTATVSPTPDGGTVAFTDDGGAIPGCTAQPLSSDGTATCQVTPTAAGSHTIQAAYSGYQVFASSTSPTLSQQVQDSTSTSLSSSANPSLSGQVVTYTATVSPVPDGGTVSFSSDYTTACSSQPVSSNGTATCRIEYVAVAVTDQHFVTADYSGDGNYLASSGSLTQTVEDISATTTSLTASPSALPIGKTDKLVATVQFSDGSGTVAFTEGAQTLSGCGAVPLTAAAGGVDQAVCKTSWSAPGSYTVMATYSGDSRSSTSSGTTTVTVNPVPIVSSVSPKAGPTAGGQTVTITGSNLSGATKVSFGGTLATNVNVLSDSQLTATAPAHAAGTVNVTVTSPLGKSATTLSDRYTYDPPPTVSSITPAAGANGTVVIVNGTGFVPGAKVAFGTSPASKVVRVSSTELKATAPAGSGTVGLTVTTPGGTSASSPADQFTYTS